MASPLVRTKLFVPRLRHGVVSRSRLSERLDAGAETKLTLVSAPAGFGKTTAVAAWLNRAAATRSVAWLSLEESDREPTSFWTYLISAVQSVVPDLGDGVLALLRSARPPMDTVLAMVVNEFGALPDDLTVVLDDYHLADGPDVAGGMAFLLEHLPPQVHVLLTTRADPDLPLARLRARGDLVEVRAADLRFTAEEVSVYFRQAVGMDLAEGDIAALAARTEGWAAALQLTALSLRGNTDVAGFIKGAGDDRYIVDYLVEEVLARQSDRVRGFLMQTSILDRLTGDLCDAVTGQPGGKAMLEFLDRANLFLVPLDDSRRWYRYHHLFADVLQVHLRDEDPEQIPVLHRRAGRWYEAAGEPAPAVRHMLTAGDVGPAADLMQRFIPALQRNRQEATVRGWLDDVPDEVVQARPVLAVGFIGALMSRGEYDDVPDRLRAVERWLDRAGPAVADDAELARLPAAVELHRAGLALIAGDAAGTHRHARRAIDRAAPGDHVTPAGASALSGLASWGAGDLEAAHRGYTTCVAGLRRAGHVSDVLGCSITLADIRITQGRLGEALATYESALRLAAAEPARVRGTADMYAGMSEIALERGHLRIAEEHLRQAQDLGEALGLPQYPYRWRVAAARVRQAGGDLAGALTLVEDAERVYTGDYAPNVRPVPAQRARLLVSHGRLDAALGWARQQALSSDDDLSYRHEYEHITLARVLLAQHRTERADGARRRAAGLLDRLLAAAEHGMRTGNVIEILVLQALVHHAGGDLATAVARLRRALTLAEPEGYVRVFTGEGPAMATLLRSLAAREPAWSYPRRLLGAGEATTPAQPGIVDPLSDRELQVLRLLASDLDGPDLARHLVVSLNTLRTHTRNIYAKLGVNSRRAAVRRAGELNLLAGD